MKDYLSNRSQFVNYDGTNSSCQNISTGVPQGSILGPLLFLIYINDLANASDIFKPIIYADDTSLTCTINSFNIENNENLDSVIINEVSKVSEWLNVNELSLNIDKTKFMIFHTQNKHVPQLNLSINGVNIDKVESFNFLGITLDTHLNWNAHINKVSTKIGRAAGIINRLKHQLPTNIKIKLYNSLILCHINYGILLWGHKFTKLVKLQKKAVRAISISKYNAHSDPIFKELNLLKINDIHKLAVIKFFYKFFMINFQNILLICSNTIETSTPLIHVELIN